LNYRHVYHAGNFADVFKHVTLWLLLEAMHRKAKPFFCLDTHAAGAAYPLDGDAQQRTGAAATGIQRLWRAHDLPAPVAGYRDWVAAWPGNRDSQGPRSYPGSASLAQAFLRDNDRLVVCDSVPEAAQQLKLDFAQDGRVTVHERDGYAALAALLPPQERRGVVLIDPPYEAADEFQQLVGGLERAHQRFAHGIFALWYPLKDPEAVADFYDKLAATGIRRLLLAELWPLPADVTGRFHGAGMVIVNPPWQIDDQLRLLAPGLLDHLADDRERAGARVEWLVGE